MPIKILRGNEAIRFANEHRKSLPTSRNFFQSPVFLQLWDGLNAFEPWFMLSGEQDYIESFIMGVLMRNPLGRTMLSSRFIAWGAPFFSSATEKTMHTGEMLDALLKAVPPGTVYIEFRNLEDETALETAFFSRGFTRQPYVNLKIPLAVGKVPSEDYHPSRLRQIRQARDKGITVFPAGSPGEVRIWYDMLHAHYRSTVRKPLPPYSFFSKFYDLSKKEECGDILLARQHGSIIGGLMLAGIPGGPSHLWYIGGKRKVSGTGSPMALVYDQAIQYSTMNRCSYVDLMGGGLEGRYSGVREYKRGFGPEESVDGRFLLVRRPWVYNLGKWYIARKLGR